MSTKTAAKPEPSESQTPASNGGSEGAPPSSASPTGESAVSDTLQLTAGLDNAYTGFDPSVHAVGADGLPVMRKGGGYARKRGRKAGVAQDSGAANATGASVANATPGAEPAAQAPQAAKPTRMSDKQASYMLTGMNSMLWTAILGDEWRYATTDEGKAEFIRHAAAVQEYLKATGGIDLSPGWGLAFAFGDYAAPRIHAEKTRGKLATAWAWCKSKFGKAG